MWKTFTTTLLLVAASLSAECSLAEADVLLWRASTNDRFFVANQNIDTRVFDGSILNFRRRVQKSRYFQAGLEPGVRISLTKPNVWGSLWDLTARYQYYGFDQHEEIKGLPSQILDSRMISTRPFSSIRENIGSNKASWDLDTHTADIGLKMRICLGNQVKILPETGMRISWLSSQFIIDSTYRFEDNSENFVCFAEIEGQETEKHWGLGPQIRIEGRWDVGCNFGLFTTFAAAFLYKTKDFSQNELGARFDSVDSINDSDDFFLGLKYSTRRITELEAEMAVGGFWRFTLAYGLTGTLQLSWEHHARLNSFEFGRDYTTQGLTIKGGLAF